MNIEEIIRAWKAEKPGEPNQDLPKSPVGDELSDEELESAVGGQEVQEWNAMANTTYGKVNCHTQFYEKKHHKKICM